MPYTETAHIEVNRDTLYEEVWETPMSRLAERYGVSDVAIKKACRKMNVPTPPRGYWARVRNGQVVRRPALPAPAPDAPGAHTFSTRHHAFSVSEDAVAKPDLPAQLLAASAATVRESLRDPDPVVARTREALKGQRLDRYGRVWPRGGGMLDVHVCPPSLPRALRILDAIMKGARRAGFDIDAGGPDERVHFLIEGEAVPFRLRETTRQERLEHSEGDPPWLGRRVQYRPTGRLTLELTDRSHTRQRTWSDTDRQPLGDVVGAFLIAAYEAARLDRDRRVQREREREEVRRQGDEQRQLEKLRLEEAERWRRLEVQAEGWRRSQEVAAFVAEVERRSAVAPMTADDREALYAWLRWAHEHVERLDPLRQGLPRLEVPPPARLPHRLL